MIQPSLYSRITTLILTFVLSGFGNFATMRAQDISGGASVLLASVDVEARLGKGIFTSQRNIAHATRRLEIVARVKSAHVRQTGGGQITDNGNGNGDLNGGPLGGAARHVLTAAQLNEQGDAYFDEAKYDKALQSYQQAVKAKPDYAEAYLNIGQTLFNLGKFDDAIAAEK